MSELSFRFLQVARRVDPLLRTHSSQLSSFPSDPPKQTVETTVAVVPTTVYSVQVSSTQVPITVANGEVSVSLVRSFFLPYPPFLLLIWKPPFLFLSSSKPCPFFSPPRLPSPSTTMSPSRSTLPLRLPLPSRGFSRSFVVPSLSSPHEPNSLPSSSIVPKQSHRRSGSRRSNRSDRHRRWAALFLAKEEEEKSSAAGGGGGWEVWSHWSWWICCWEGS